MHDASFEIDYIAVPIALVAFIVSFLLYKRKGRYTEPTFYFSDLDPSLIHMNNWKNQLTTLAHLFNYIALALFLVAFADPHLIVPKKPQDKPQIKDAIPTEGIAIYLLLDQSGSMAEDVTATINGNRQTLSKEDLLRQVTTDFVKGDSSEGLTGRSNDMIGLVTFARVPQVLSPLTLDHQMILKELAKIHVVKQKDDDGTAMGYAIYKTVSMIAATKHYAEELAGKGSPSYTIKSSVIILVTDGLQDPSILDKDSRLRNIGLEQAAEFAKANGVRLYLINIDPNTYSSDLSPQRNQMESITKLTGGRLFIVNDPGEITKIYSEIDNLEKSVLPQEGISKEKQPHLFRRLSFYPYLIGVGVLLLLCSILIQTVAARRVP